nr:MAG: capsid protein [Cressdnaviricota sp.]
MAGLYEWIHSGYGSRKRKRTDRRSLRHRKHNLEDTFNSVEPEMQPTFAPPPIQYQEMMHVDANADITAGAGAGELTRTYEVLGAKTHAKESKRDFRQRLTEQVSVVGLLADTPIWTQCVMNSVNVAFSPTQTIGGSISANYALYDTYIQQQSSGLSTRNQYQLKYVPVKSTQKYRMYNQGSFPVECTAYTICPRRDVADNGLAASNNNTPLEIVLNTTPGTGGYTNNFENLSASLSSYLYATPYESHAMCSLYKICGVKKFVMTAGGYHEHTVKKHGGTEFRYYRIATAEKNLALSDLTVYTLFVFKCRPTNQTSYQTSIGTLPPQVGMIVETNYIYRMKNLMPPRLFITQSLGATIPTIGTTTRTEQDGQIVNTGLI